MEFEAEMTIKKSTYWIILDFSRPLSPCNTRFDVQHERWRKKKEKEFLISHKTFHRKR